jgi:pilus assembly protein CpaF
VSDLTDLFTNDRGDRGASRMMQILSDPKVSQITADRFDRITFIDDKGPKRLDHVFAGPAQYKAWLNELLEKTDVGFTDVDQANSSEIEGSFRPDRIAVHGSIHICTREITHGDPALTVRKQPHQVITLDHMFGQGMLNADMRMFLEQAVRGRSNILISGGSGAGKTTLTRALSYFIDPAQRVISVEEIQELRLSDRLPNTVELFTVRKRDATGALIRETTLEDLVRMSLRMRGDRVWVGETRGREAYALVKACNSGHDGSVTTIHADSGRQAIKQAITYVMESGLPEQVAREQVSQAFNLVVQINKVSMDRRVITEIAECEPVLEGNVQRMNPLYSFENDARGGHWGQQSRPTQRLLQQWARNGANYDGVPGRM